MRFAIPLLASLLPVSAWRLLAVGQSHIASDIASLQTDLLSTLFPPALRTDDVCDRGFSDFEGWADRPNANRRVILEPIPLPALQRLTTEGLTVFALANNHAFDGLEEGIEGTREAMRSVHATFAGTGDNATDAAAFAMLPCTKVPTAFISIASGGVDATIIDRAQAQDDRSGINMVALTPDNVPDPTDLERVLESVRSARRAVGPQGVVLFSHHNHLATWNETSTTRFRALDPTAGDPAPWLFPFVESLLEAGVSIYLGHGNPLVQGFAIVKGKPVFYGLGSFVFQVTPSNDATFGPLAWDGIAADIRIVGKDFQIKIKPLEIERNRADVVHFGLPSITNTTNGQRIMERFLNNSARYGTQFMVDETRTVATLQMKIAEEKIPKGPPAPKPPKKASKAPMAIGVSAAAVFVIGGVGLRRRQILRARAKAAAVPPQEQFSSVSISV